MYIEWWYILIIWEECNSNNQLIKATYSIIFYRPPLKKLRFLRYFIFSFYQADQASEVHSDSPRVVSGNLRQLQQQLSQLQLQDSDHYQGKITYYEVFKVFTLWGLMCKYS